MRDLRGVISVCSSLLGDCSGIHQFNQFISVSVLNAHSWWCYKTFPVAEINCIITRRLATFFEMVHLKTELKKYQNPQSRTLHYFKYLNIVRAGYFRNWSYFIFCLPRLYTQIRFSYLTSMSSVPVNVDRMPVYCGGFG